MALYHKMVNLILGIGIVVGVIGIAIYWGLHFAKKAKEQGLGLGRIRKDKPKR